MANAAAIEAATIGGAMHGVVVDCRSGDTIASLSKRTIGRELAVSLPIEETVASGPGPGDAWTADRSPVAHRQGRRS